MRQNARLFWSKFTKTDVHYFQVVVVSQWCHFYSSYCTTFRELSFEWSTLHIRLASLPKVRKGKKTKGSRLFNKHEGMTRKTVNIRKSDTRRKLHSSVQIYSSFHLKQFFLMRTETLKWQQKYFLFQSKLFSVWKESTSSSSVSSS